MAYNVETCIANLLNTGPSACKGKLGYDAMLLWTSESFEIANEAAALLEATYVDATDARTMFPMKIFDEIEPAIEDDNEQELSTGVTLFVREGKYGGIGRFELDLCSLPKYRTFNEVSGRAFIVTGNGKIYGTSPDGVKFKGFKLSKLHVSKLGGTDGSTLRFVDVRYQFKTPSEMADFPAVPNIGTTWDPLTLQGLIDVTVTVDASAEGEVTLSVASDCDGEAIIGLVTGDFTILASDGTTEMLPGDGFADNGDGTYTWTFTTPVLPADTYTANLKTAALQTTGGYSPGTADSFIIS